MPIALATLFDVQVIANIVSYYPQREAAVWEPVCGSCVIGMPKHIVTHHDGGICGFAYLLDHDNPRWYRWRRPGFGVDLQPEYTSLEKGVVAVKWAGGEAKSVGVLPLNWEEFDSDEDDDEIMAVLDDDAMRG